ncbi:MAG: ferrochelatase [Chlamydiia bacterium]|nr:ferrochelatase [Chlamydiia bacterium]
MAKKKKIGVLLVNVGTPQLPTPALVSRYLTEFLSDPRVIDIPYLKRFFLVRCCIVPLRKKRIARCYESIWTEKGSPLLVNCQNFTNKLQDALGCDYIVRLAMRYQLPSLEVTLQELQKLDLSELVVFPLFPQYASPTTGSILEKVSQIVSQWNVIPNVKMIAEFHDHPLYIQALAKQGSKYAIAEYDHILFSFHGLPERLMKKSSPSYQRDCLKTAALLAEELEIPQERYTVTFQSRLGSEPWCQPYTSDVVKKLAKAGSKKILVFSPAFVADCLETIYEIGVELQQEFRESEGECLELVEALNDSPLWTAAAKTLIMENR